MVAFGAAVEVTTAMAVDTAKTSLMVEVRRTVVSIIPVVIFKGDVLGGNSTIKGLVPDTWVIQSGVICCIISGLRVLGILKAVVYVLILVQSDPPILKHCTV